MFFKDTDGYSVVFPDLNYTATCGATLDEAMTMAVDCLAGYIYSAKRDGETVPPPSDVSEVRPADVAAELGEPAGEAFVNLVTVDVAEYAKSNFEKSVKINAYHKGVPTWQGYKDSKKIRLFHVYVNPC